MSHTPGPWRVVTMDNGFGVRHRFIGSYGQGFAHTVGLFNPTEAANARLIAAAPDLLAACQIAVDLIEDYVQGRPEVAEQMRAAIAKAIIG